MRLIIQCCVGLYALVLIGAATPANAQAPGQHPEYLHAIRNLRQARGILEGNNFTTPGHAQAATATIHDIDKALDHLKAASKLDDKSLGDVPPPRTDMTAVGRFHQANDLLKAARHDASGPESDPAAVQYRLMALNDIDAALKVVEVIAQ
jgi:hypothetical protein